MAKEPHFFKAHSKLGARYKLIRQDHYIGGVEDAPDYILNPEFLKNFPDAPVDEYNFSTPDKIPKDKYYQVLAVELEKFANLINKKIQPRETQVVIGGDNAVTFSSMLAVLKRIKNIKSVGFVQFDSHGEMHLFASSISKNFHGMYMRPFFDNFDIKDIEKLVPKKLNPSQAFTIGDIIFDEGDNHPHGEVEFYKKIRNVSRNEFLKNKKGILKEFENFTKKFKHIFIDFDIDVFDSSAAGATGEAEGVWFWEEIVKFLEIIQKHPSISLDLVEINPYMKGTKRTIKVAHEILLKVLS